MNKIDNWCWIVLDSHDKSGIQQEEDYIYEF
jgi:hypothetical protein